MENIFKFLDPGELIDGDLKLVLLEKRQANIEKDYVPGYDFEMRNIATDNMMGSISLRVGYNEGIKYGGNLGYGVEKIFQGQRYASRSVKLLLPLAKRHGMKVLWITCNPDNIASRKTSELSGFELVEIVDLPKHNEQYKRGERQKCLYKISL